VGEVVGAAKVYGSVPPQDLPLRGDFDGPREFMRGGAPWNSPTFVRNIHNRPVGCVPPAVCPPGVASNFNVQAVGPDITFNAVCPRDLFGWGGICPLNPGFRWFINCRGTGEIASLLFTLHWFFEIRTYTVVEITLGPPLTVIARGRRPTAGMPPGTPDLILAEWHPV